MINVYSALDKTFAYIQDDEDFVDDVLLGRFKVEIRQQNKMSYFEKEMSLSTYNCK